MNLPIRKAAIVLTKDDPEGLKHTIDHILPYFSAIYIGYDLEFPDPKSTNLKLMHVVFSEHDDKNGFGWKRTYIDKLAKNYQIHVHIDCDEVWDTAVLTDLVKTVTKEKPCWRSPRCNMPDGHAYPDYQVRVFWYTPAMHWVGDVHELLYDGDKPADQGKNVGTFKTPIMHLPRNQQLNRKWWKQ